MKKLLAIIFTLLITISLISCDKEEEPIRVDNDETEAIENLSEGTKERLVYLRSETLKSEESTSKWSIIDFFDGLLTTYRKSSEDTMMYDTQENSLEVETEKGSSIEGETSTTNVIVDGVDEADNIKNDTRYLYCIKNWCSQELVVVDSETLESVTYNFYKEEETVSVDGEEKVIEVVPYYQIYRNRIQGLYLTENNLIVIMQKNNDLLVRVYDTTNPLKMELADEYKYENAYYSDSRMIDDELILIYENEIFDDEEILPIKYYQNDLCTEVTYNNVVILEEEEDSDVNNYYYGSEITTVSKINLTTEDVKVKGFYGLKGYEYSVSKNNVYLIDSVYYDSDSTDFYRIDLETLTLKGKVNQKGSINNLYSIDEYNGVLRVATTESHWAGYTYKNYLSTYDVTGDEFKILDTINFADDEKIYSASFEGDLGYIVTYLYIDPLFEFDLSDPKDIKLLRQLESPGVSDYLDYINDDFILGIGRMTTEHDNGYGEYATSDGVKLSLFSLDNEEMKEEYTYTFDYDYSYTSAQYNHHDVLKLNNSLTYFIPFNYSIYSVNNKVVSNKYFSGILAFRVDTENRSIKIIGELEANSDRMCVINGKLFVLSSSNLLVVNVTDKLEVVDTIE